MIIEVYDAFISAGVDEEKAKKAAKALSNEQLATKGDIALLERRLIRLEVLISIMLAILLIPTLKTFFS